MDKRKLTKLFALMCALVLTVGLCSTIVLAEATLSNPITVNGKSYDNDKTAPEKYDISIMSYNILQNGSGSYDYPDRRLNYIVANIQVYEPDIIGVQEASHTKVTASNGSSFYWDTALPKALEKLGYAALYLGSQNGTNTTTIGHGLIIFYKSDRFTMTDNGYKNYSTSATYTRTDGSSATKTDNGRWFQWAKFIDQTNGSDLYFYNTHLSVDPSDSSASSSQLLYAGNQFRTQQFAALLADVNTRATATPCFITGDFNTKNSLASTTEGVELLGLINNYPYLSDSATVADATVSADPKDRIDHIFFNDNYAKAIKHRAVQENIDGRATSDHFALVSYLNYSCAATINGKAYDEVNRTYTETTDSAKFTFNIADTTQTQNLTWTINGSTANTVTLTKATNTFDIAFSANGKVLNTVRATIQYTGATKPTLTTTGTQNNYFTNGAYQVIADADTVKLSVRDGTIYNGDTSLGTSYSFTPAEGRTALTLTSTSGETFPIYIYKATKSAESSKVLYVDDDMGTSGIVPYYNGTDVILVKAGTQGFDTIEKAADKCYNSTGYTIYVGTGNYNGNTTGFACGITLLGANANTSALTQDKQLNTERNEETVINGRIYIFTRGSYTYTVKGFSFEGFWDLNESSDAAIYISHDNNYLETNAAIAATVTLNIRNNIFTSYGNEFNDAVIRANSAVGKAGIISDNYFLYNGNEGDRDNRGMQIRNLNGLIIENNRFINFPSPMWLSSEYQTGSDAYTGYFNITMQNNTFEACLKIDNHIKNIDATTGGDIRYLNNDFIRCGYFTGGSPIIYLNIAQPDIPAQSLSITIQGNDFLGCLYSIGINRSAQTAVISDLSQMKVNISSNRFYQPQERGKDQANNLKSTIKLSFLVSTADRDGDTYYDFEQNVSKNWNLAYNYFYSDVYTEDSTASTTYHVYTGGKSVNDPSLYINNSVKRSADSISGSAISLTEDIYTPYYTNEAMTVLSYGSQPAQDIIVEDVDAIYDGKAHSITVPTGSDSTVTYSTDGITYSSINPSFSEIGVHPVYWMVETPGFAAASGSATVTIYKLLDQNIEYSDQTYVYNGSAQGTAIKVASDATITYTTNGEQSTAAPTFTDAGTYSVSFTVTRKYYKDFSGTYTVTIQNAPLDSVTLAGYSGTYDGAAHGVTVGALPEGVTAAFTIDGKTVENAFTDVGEYTVTVTLSGANYVTRREMVTINIVAAIITGITITPYVGEVDGQSHGVTVEGTQAGDKVYYAYGGDDYTNEAPAFTEEGIYSVTVKITRKNYQDKISVVTVVIDESKKIGYIEPLFSVKNDNFDVTQAANGKYTFNWTCELAFTEFGETALNNDEYRVLSYGVKYAPSPEYLEEYVYRYQAYGFDENATDETAVNGKINGKVAEIAVETASGNNPGLTSLYQTTKYSLNSLSEVRARYAMSYVRYYKVGDPTIYEEYGAIEIAISNYLPNSTMNGIGGTEEREDILDTNPNDGETSERDDILGK